MPESKEAQAKKEDVMQSVGAAAGIPDVSQTITQNQATRQGFSADRAMSQVMDVWKTYLASQNFTQDIAPPPSVQALATSYGASPEMMGPAPPTPSSSITQSAAIPAAAIEAPKIGATSQGYAISPEGEAQRQAAEAAARQGTEQRPGQGVWSADVLAKYPELANVTDPAIIQQLQNLPDITLKDVQYGPGWTDSKGRYTSDQMFKPQVAKQLQAAGMMKDGKMIMPTTQDELNRWAYMKELLGGMKSNQNIDYGWTYKTTGTPTGIGENGVNIDNTPTHAMSGYTPWTQAHFLSEGKFDPAKYASVVAADTQNQMYGNWNGRVSTDTSYGKWMQQNQKASPATTGAIPAPSNDTGGWA